MQFSSSDESVGAKHFTHDNFICIVFPVHLVQSTNTEFLLTKTHKCLNRSSKLAL